MLLVESGYQVREKLWLKVEMLVTLWDEDSIRKLMPAERGDCLGL